MHDDEFDLRLRQAVRPLVTEVVPRPAALDAQDQEPASRRRTARGPALPAAVAVVVVVALAGAFGLNIGAGSAGQGPSAGPGSSAVAPVRKATVAFGTWILTPDGTVSVRTSADGAHLELVLDKNDATSVVLASIFETLPTGNVSFMSVHAVDCPPSTGLAQRYYVVGQSTDSGTIVLHGLAGVAATMAGGRYVIAITSTSIPPGRWTFNIGKGGNAGGGTGASLLDLPNYGQKSDAGCFVG